MICLAVKGSLLDAYSHTANRSGLRFCRASQSINERTLPSARARGRHRALNGSFIAQGKTDARDDIIPVVFLSSGIIDQHAVNDEALGEIATVVPNLIVLVA
jgi:hypothetical protein